MSLEKLFESPAGVSPSVICYRNKPGQFFIQFQEDGKSVHDFTVDEELLRSNSIYRVHDFERNEDKLPSIEQREAFQQARNWLLGNKGT